MVTTNTLWAVFSLCVINNFWCFIWCLVWKQQSHVLLICVKKVLYTNHRQSWASQAGSCADEEQQLRLIFTLNFPLLPVEFRRLKWLVRSFLWMKVSSITHFIKITSDQWLSIRHLMISVAPEYNVHMKSRNGKFTVQWKRQTKNIY